LARARVTAGACGFTSVIKVHKVGKMKVQVQIISACQDLRSMNEDLALVDCSKGVFGKMIDSVIYQVASKRLKHPDCPIPCAIIKTIQVELDGAIPKDVIIKIERSG